MNRIVTMCQNEDDFIVDFVLYHLMIGFDNIVIFDHASANPVGLTLSCLPAKLRARVTVYRLPFSFLELRDIKYADLFDQNIYDANNESKQMYLLNYALKHILQPEDWAAFIDADEFIWLAQFKDIEEIKQAACQHGSSAFIFDALVFGHGFNLNRPEPSNVCSFAWSATSYAAHGRSGHNKFFAHVGSLTLVETPHFPSLRDGRVAVGFDLQPRTSGDRPGLRCATVGDIVHLKHYSVKDVRTCFSRRLKSRISSDKRITPTDSSWAYRISFLWWSSSRFDLTLPSYVIDLRLQLGIECSSHLLAMTHALEVARNLGRKTSSVDFAYLKSSMGADPSVSDAFVFYNYFNNPSLPEAYLRFAETPEGFTPELYKGANGDLRHLSDREAIEHYIAYGLRENRRFMTN